MRWVLRSGCALSAASRLLSRDSSPALKPGAVQPSGLPPSTGERTRPRGASPPAGCRTTAPSHVQARGRAESPPGGHPQQLSPPLTHAPSALSSSRQDPLGKAGGEMQERRWLLASPAPDSRPKSQRPGGYAASPVPEVAPSRVTDAPLVQPATGRRRSPAETDCFSPPIPVRQSPAPVRGRGRATGGSGAASAPLASLTE